MLASVCAHKVHSYFSINYPNYWAMHGATQSNDQTERVREETLTIKMSEEREKSYTTYHRLRWIFTCLRIIIFTVFSFLFGIMIYLFRCHFFIDLASTISLPNCCVRIELCELLVFFRSISINCETIIEHFGWFYTSMHWINYAAHI